MFTKPLIHDGISTRQATAGDVLGGGELLGSSGLATAGAGTITAAILATGFCIRTGPTGAYTDTTDTATAIIAAMPGVSAGDTFRFRHVNTVAYAMTLAAGTGVTLGTAPATTIAASGFKDYLVTVTNATPASVVTCSITNASKVITGMTLAQTNAISVGQSVTGTGAGSSAVVTSIQPGIGVNVSVNSSATNATASFTFSPAVRIDAISMG